MSKILIRKSGTMGMGTGTDLRIYNPRSESSTMFRHNHEDEDSVYSPEDGKYRDERAAKKKKQREERASEIKNLKHVPLTTEDIHEETDQDLEPTKFDRELEPSLMTGTAGNYGAMTSMANQARGPGFAGGHAFAMGEPMDIAFQLLKGKIMKSISDIASDALWQLRHMSHSIGIPISREESHKVIDERIRNILRQQRKFGVHDISDEEIENMPDAYEFLDEDLDDDDLDEERMELRRHIITQLGKEVDSHYYNMADWGMLTPQAEFQEEDEKQKDYPPEWFDSFKEGGLRNPRIQMRQSPYDKQTGEPMESAWSSLLKRQMTLPGYDREGVEQMTSPENSNVWIAAKPGREEISPERASQLSDSMLSELAVINRNHGPFTITSATGRAEWEEEPSFMLTGVSKKALPHIHELAERFGQQSIAISDAGSEGARFETSQGDVTDEYASMGFNPDAEYSTDFPTGQRLEFKKSILVLKRDERQGFVGRKPKREKGAKARKDHAERSRKWRPSTGEFKRPPGGMSAASATSRRAKARMRGIKGGKKTGLSRAHLAVEMSHRGVKTKQPMSKDPRRYRQYLGQQEARKRLGNVRTVAATPARYGARSYRAGSTGGGVLQSLLPGQAAAMRRSALRQIRPPQLRPPPMPRAPSVPGLTPPQSMGAQSVGVGPRLPTASVQGASPMMYTSEIGVGSEIQKRGLSYYDVAELRQLVNEARRALKRKESKKKGKGDGDTSGAGSNLPRHNNAPTKETTNPTGATEDAKNDARTFGTNPLEHLVGRGGRTP